MCVALSQSQFIGYLLDIVTYGYRIMPRGFGSNDDTIKIILVFTEYLAREAMYGCRKEDTCDVFYRLYYRRSTSFTHMAVSVYNGACRNRAFYQYAGDLW